VLHLRQHKHKVDQFVLDDPQEVDVSLPTIVLVDVEVVHFAVHEKP